MKKKFPFYITEKRNAVDVQPVMQFAQSKLFPWLKIRKDFPIHKLMGKNVFVVISVLEYVQ